MKVTHFRDAAALRAWLVKHHRTVRELWVGYRRKDSGEPSITWPESVDEALCFGWIDGIRKRVDARSYTIRFTPRRAKSIWSAINIRRMAALEKSGRMRAAGRKAFESRRENRSGIYSYEQVRPRLEAPYGAMLRRDKAASKFFDAQPPFYRKIMGWWVVSAKKEETRLRRLEMLRKACAEGRRLR